MKIKVQDKCISKTTTTTTNYIIIKEEFTFKLHLPQCVVKSKWRGNFLAIVVQKYLTIALLLLVVVMSPLVSLLPLLPRLKPLPISGPVRRPR